ncbi:holo-ACP synthase [Bifidobacterium miconisargentati]|uniref:holo-ACP synthase n=1 Tax=Bifidobacterium miconisargentati TaxID=2834437 RepID=UPI001BDCE07A|nr:4'-phosphopantetheinyl transferase superfamily protein [Bifidobacterium miconisargentati]MBW3089708.1 4'-phosphopantetheinyl transferase superfamily protein [Bifidobacterium miconisargentati]
MGVTGLGHDVVDVAAFADQLTMPGSHMRNLFSVREVRQASERARVKNDGETVHLAAKWAGKEAFLKAWCEALGERPYSFTLDNFPWHEVEILDDSRGVPHVMLAGKAAQAFRDVHGESTASDSRKREDSVFQTDYAGSSHGASLVADKSPSIHISLSHDGPVASAVVMISVD